MKFSPGFKKYFINTSWLMAERISRMIVGLFVGIYVARYLEPEQFGLLNYSISFVGLFLALSTLGLDGIVIRELVKTPEKRNELLGTVFCLKILGALLMWLCVAAIFPLTNSDRQTALLVSIIAFSTIFQAFNVIDFNYQAEVKAKLVVHIQFIQVIISSLIKIGLIWREASLLWFGWVYLFDAITLSTGLYIIYSINTGQILEWSFKFQIAQDLLKDSWPLVFSGIAVSIYLRIDQVMIKEMLGATEVGLYAAAVKLSEAWYFIPIVISSSLFPAIINAKKESEEIYFLRLQQFYDLMVLIAFGIALPTTFLSHWIINILFGGEYILAANVLSINIWTGIFVFLGTASSKWYLAENLTSLMFYRVFAGAITNIILNIILIPKLYIIGAAVATLASNFVAAYAYDLVNKKTRQVFISKTKSLIFYRVLKWFF